MLCSGQPADMSEHICVSCWSKVQKTTFINSILTLGHYKHFENACLCSAGICGQILRPRAFLLSYAWLVENWKNRVRP